MKEKQTLLAALLAATLTIANCTSNATILNDTATALNPTTTATGSGSTDAELAKKLRSIWIVGGTKTAASANPPAAAVAVDAYARDLDYYDPVTNTWETVAASTFTGTFTPVLAACYGGYNGKIFVAGGLQENNTFNSAAPTNLTQIYDIATNTWSTGANMPLAVSAAACAVHQNQYLYVTGGSSGNANVFTLNNAANILMRYDMASNAWASTAAGAAPAAPAATTAATDSCMVSDGFSLYKFNGKTAAATLGAVASFAAYNVTSGAYGNITFQAPAPLRVGSSCVWLPATADLPARYLSLGGLGGANLTGNTTAISIFSNSGASTALTGTYAVSSPYQSAAAAGANLPAARSHGAAVVKGNTIYYFGGNSGFGATPSPTPTNTVYAANTELVFWTNKLPFTTTPIPTMPTARWGHGAVLVQ